MAELLTRPRAQKILVLLAVLTLLSLAADPAVADSSDCLVNDPEEETCYT